MMHAFTQPILAHGLSDALPTLVRDQGLVMMQFSVMKVLPAFSCIDSARRRGTLKPGAPVIETSSGSFAYGLARMCAATGHPLTIVSADLEPWLHQALVSLEAQVELVDAKGDLSLVQRIRLDRLKDIQGQTGAYWPCQYDNPANPDGYVPAAELLAAQHGVPDILVCPVGSGGNSAGLSRLLRSVDPGMRLVGVDCFGSVSFGLDVGHRELGGIGNSLMPRCVDHTAFDEVHWINGAVGVDGARRIQADGFGDFGLTSGAAYVVARWLQRRHPGARIAVVFPDRAFRYADRIAAEPHFDTRDLHPATVMSLAGVAPPWSRVIWGRRPLARWARRQGAEVRRR